MAKTKPCKSFEAFKFEIEVILWFIMYWLLYSDWIWLRLKLRSFETRDSKIMFLS